MNLQRNTSLALVLFILAGCAPLSAPEHSELVIHEHPLQGAPDISTDRLKFEFIEEYQQETLAATEAYRDFRSQVANYNNRALALFGYILKTHRGEPYQGEQQYFDIYRGENLVAADIQFMTPLSVNASKTDFIAFADAFNGQSYVFTKDGFTKRPWPIDRQPYAYVGNQLLSVETKSLTNQELLIKVFLDDQETYQSRIYAGRPTYGITDGPWSYNGHWALVILDGKPDNEGNLEMLTRVVQDGQDLNTEFGYEQSFQFAVLAGHPFYFFRRAGKIGISFDGQEILKGYDEIPHYTCCSAALRNPGISMNMIWFFARRGRDWYYVEAYVPAQDK